MEKLLKRKVTVRVGQSIVCSGGDEYDSIRKSLK